MKKKTAQNTNLLDHVKRIPEPRYEKKCHHPLVNIVAITICAVIAGADDWNSIAAFGRAKKDWFGGFLDISSGIPSHDTFRRFFSILSPRAFQEFFDGWVKEIAGQVEGVVAIDGKTVRRSHDRGTGKSAIHVVSAWASECGLVLGQVKTEEKSNEIKAIPELLRVLELNNCIVTIDAMGCQKAIVKQIHDQGGDYLIAVKRNQETLYSQVETSFLEARFCDFEGYDVDYHETEEKSRNRFERRRHWVLDLKDSKVDASAWKGLGTIGLVQSHRTIGNETSIENRYYIGSIEKDAARFARSVRAHWGVENNLHWQLDVSFREDESRMRKGHSAENFVTLRHFALNLLKKDKTTKLGMKNKRLKAGWDNDYLAKLLNSG